jgi:hypothetical protein
MAMADFLIVLASRHVFEPSVTQSEIQHIFRMKILKKSKEKFKLKKNLNHRGM